MRNFSTSLQAKQITNLHTIKGGETSKDSLTREDIINLLKNGGLKNPILISYLDKDKDGDIMDDARNMIGGFLGKK